VRFLKKDAKTIAGTTVLSTLVIVFDYSMKYSGLKIPFPWLLYLKFDFTGVPIVLSWMLFGLTSGTITSTVALLGILIRSGDPVGASMKALAELSTVLGMALATKLIKKPAKSTTIASFISGLSTRCITMFFANLTVLPFYYKIPMPATIALTPLITAFNMIQGLISMFLGFFLYNIIIHRTSLNH